MKVMIELPYEAYDQLRNKCDPSSPEFILLINGCIEARAESAHIMAIVQMLCEKEQAIRLLDLATSLCPDAIPAIKRSLRSPAD
jgi:hypothetical protein